MQIAWRIWQKTLEGFKLERDMALETVLVMGLKVHEEEEAGEAAGQTVAVCR